MSHLLPRVCSMKGCDKAATHFAGLMLYAKHGDGITSHLDLPVCPDHAHSLKVSDVISDSGWEKIVKSLRGLGKADPVRSKTEVFVVPIDEAPDIFRNRYEPARGGS